MLRATQFHLVYSHVGAVRRASLAPAQSSNYVDTQQQQRATHAMARNYHVRSEAVHKIRPSQAADAAKKLLRARAGNALRSVAPPWSLQS